MVDCWGVMRGFTKGFLLGLVGTPYGGFLVDCPFGRETGGVVARFLVTGVVDARGLDEVKEE